MNDRFPSDPAKHEMPNRRSLAGRLTALGALLLCVALVSSARADSASCLAKLSSYVAELDELLSKERNLLTPYDDLNERYFPFRDCEADALLEIARSSRFIRSISHNGRLNEYFIHFSNDQVKVGLYYYASERKPEPGFNTATWVHK
jgi:hypothetical protein